MGLNLNVGSAMSKITSGLTSSKLAGKTSFNTSNLDTITNTLSGKSKVQLKNYTYQKNYPFHYINIKTRY